MEFLNQNNVPPPKNLYPCLATITIQPAGDKGRRLSSSSHTSGGGEEENVLKRIASGGRRKSDAANDAAGAGSGRRKSFVLPPVAGSGADVTPERGTWYWRVQAGVSDNALILLPLTQPPNPVLTSAPQPLSQAMPAHSHHAHGHGSHAEDEGLVDKVKNLFRRGSAAPSEKTTASSTTAGSGAGAASTPQGDKVIDQTAQGEQLPSASANSAGATNVNANAETGWPGVISGEKLQAIGVPLHTIDKSKIALSGGKKSEGYYITVPVTSAFAAMTAGYSDSGPGAKSGVIKLEFDKDWIGAKAESELLHHHLTSAVNDRSPAAQQLQLGGHNHPIASGALPSSHPNPGMEERLTARRVSQGNLAGVDQFRAQNQQH